jgi:hypothetical protein
MTGYKRPDLLFSDLERLRTMNSTSLFQFVMAGKAHRVMTRQAAGCWRRSLAQHAAAAL